VRPPLAYSPGRSPLHRAPAWATIAFLGSFAVVAFAFSNPLVLLADGIAVTLAGLASGSRRAVTFALRLAVPLMVLMAAVNALVVHRGETVLVRGWNLPVLGNTDITLESLAAGGVIGMRVVVVLIAFAVYSACVNPDAVLRAMRPVARRSALSAALVSRLVPLAVADLARAREAAALRGPAAAPVGRAVMARRLVEGSLDRSIDVAATLELRGHSLDVGGARRREPAGPSALLAIAAAGVIAACAAGLTFGAGGFDAYPQIWVDLDAGTLALSAALPLLALVPFAGALLRGSRG
jgi:energy-coupling factor transporter transmembrane protein EcfT